LENLAEPNLEAVSGYDRTIAWEPIKTPQSLLLREKSTKFNSTSSQELAMVSEPKLFLLEGTTDIEPSSSGKMGLAPPEAQEGDYVCQIQGVTKALIVRKRVGLRVIGTGVMAENKFLARIRRDSAQVRSIFSAAEFSAIHHNDRLGLTLDIATVYELLN